MVRIDGDLIPSISGVSNLGVDGNASQAIDTASITPFGRVHQVSGIFHDPILGQSGVLRYSREQAAFQVSVDGGLTFVNLSAGGVDSVGVIGDVNLVGNIDLAVPFSGFLNIFDTADASPINFAVDHLGLSGLWDFPTQGFNGRVVNALTDLHGTEAQGVVNVVGISGIIVDIVGQTMTIGPAANQIARCTESPFTDVDTHTIVHNFGTTAVIVQVRDTADQVLIPDTITITDGNNVTITFNNQRSGTAIVIGC